MDAAVAAVTADFAHSHLTPGQIATTSTSTSTATSGRPSRNNRGNGRGRGNGRTRGARMNGSSRPSTSASASENESSNVVDLPAPATQITNTNRRNNNNRQQQPQQPRYRSQLSEAEPAIAIPTTSSSAIKTSIPTAEELAALSYRERLTVQLNTSSIECPICYNAIHRKQPISSCQTCSAPYHLKCLRDWAERSIAAVKEKAALQQPGVHVRANWRCPSCQTQHGENEIPRNYKCFCGRAKDPKGSGLGNAHSCEKPCRRNRPEGCTHSCPLTCHPANCDPCNVMLRMQCHCGKESKTILCGTLHPSTSSSTSSRVDTNDFLSCKQSCSKLLGCGLHRCGKECHSGACGPCEIIREKTCFCGSVSEQRICGGSAEAELRNECYSPETQEKDKSWTGEFSCGQPCPWTYDCGVHKEATLADTSGGKTFCHPHHSSTPLQCPRSPSIVTTCACGQTPLSSLSSSTRENCRAAIPSCGKVCNKTRPECGHACTKICHEGDCGECQEIVKLVCRCGNDKKSMKCVELQKQGEGELLCDKACKALRNCGRHECGRRCCPLAFQEAHQKQRKRPLSHADEEDPMGYHVCDRVCNRMLNCGQHRCQLPDHRGACQPCLRSSFEELTCHCGSTTLLPPVPCSTRIVCNQPCARPGPVCGHPKAPHACHEDDQPCPPCPFLTSKQCACHRHAVVNNVRCSQANVSCGKTCDALLGCGYHKCKKMCHPEGECQECTQTCGKPRAYCGHPCQQKCHAPSKCPTDEPCSELVEATCPCGHIKQRTRCGACNSKTDPNGGVKLACNQTCIVAQRNNALAEALGISKDRQAASGQAVTWLPETIAFYGENITWCKSIEQVFIDFIGSTRATHMFPAMKQPQRKFVHEVAEKFKLRSESLDEEPFRSVLVARKTDSAAPKPSLSEAWVQQYKSASSTAVAAKKQSLVTQPASSATTPAPQVQQQRKQEINALYLEACFGYDEQSLKEVIAPFMQGMYFTLRWINDEDVICVPRSTLTPSELTLKLRLVRNSIRHKIPSCKAVDAAYFDTAAETVTHRDRQWTSVSSTNGAAAPAVSRWTALTSAASSLAPSRQSSRPASPNPRDVDIIGNGLNRPPTAVIVNGSNAQVAENWEDSL